jgi:hypothetical protein
MSDLKFLRAAADCGIHSSYYALCDNHPLRPSLPSISISSKNLLEATSGAVPLEKLRGPGSVYKLLALPDGIALNLIIQQRTTVETHFNISSGETIRTGTFAILCKQILESNDEPVRSPPYPRPTFHSIEELIDILVVFDKLVRKLGTVT